MKSIAMAKQYSHILTSNTASLFFSQEHTLSLSELSVYFFTRIEGFVGSSRQASIY
jgi:hypothetical protein